VQIDAKDDNVIVATGKLVMMLRGITSPWVTTQPCFHLMADQGFDLKGFALCRTLGTWTRGVGLNILASLREISGAALVATSTQVLVIRSAPSFISATAGRLAVQPGGSVLTLSARCAAARSESEQPQ